MNVRAPRLATAGLLTLLTAPVQADDLCDFGAPHPEAPPETTQFDFLIGEFTVSLHSWQGDRWSPPRPAGARWNGRYGLNGMAIYDEWFDPGPEDVDGTWGVNVRTYDPQARLWKVMWISLPARQVQDMRAQLRDGIFTLWQVHPERPDWRAEFEVQDEDHWARVSYVRDGPNGEWSRQFRLAATRIPCGG